MTREEIKAKAFDKIADFLCDWDTDDKNEVFLYKLSYIEGYVDAAYDIMNLEEKNESEAE